VHNQETQQRFIFMRSQGSTFAHIAQQLDVSRGTLVNWSRKFQFEINNLRAMELEDLQDKLIATRQRRARALGDQLKLIEAELNKRDISELSTRGLFSLADSLRRQILRETGEIEFATPTRDFENGETIEMVKQWTP
jgi:transposase